MRGGNTEFKCHVCDYVTQRKGWLIVHIRKHTGKSFLSFNKCQGYAGTLACVRGNVGTLANVRGT